MSIINEAWFTPVAVAAGSVVLLLIVRAWWWWEDRTTQIAQVRPGPVYLATNGRYLLPGPAGVWVITDMSTSLDRAELTLVTVEKWEKLRAARRNGGTP